MNDVVRRMLWLAPLALLMAVAVPAAGAGQEQSPPREDLFDLRVGPGKRSIEMRLERRGRRGVRDRAREAAISTEAPPGAATASPAAPAGTAFAPVPSPAAPSPSPAAPAPAPVAAAPSAPASDPPSGPVLSDDAPDTPPVIGVVGGGESKGPSPTPEPSSLLLMGTGLAGLYRLARRRRE